MTNRKRTESYGRYIENEVFAKFNDLSERAYAEYHKMAGQPGGPPEG
jgi:hypothetical protein